MSQLLQFTPQSRLTPHQACCHPFFAQLRDPQARLPNGRPLPPLFNLTEHGTRGEMERQREKKREKEREREREAEEAER